MAQDHEVFMAQKQLDAIIKHANDLKSKIGTKEVDIPAWIQDHISNAENFIHQAAEGFYTNESIKIKDLPKFSEFVNEAAKTPKSFEKVKVGDKALDINDEKWTIVGKAKGIKAFNSIKQYDESGAMEDFLHSPADWEDDYKPNELEMVAAKSSEYGFAVFVYGDGGLEVY